MPVSRVTQFSLHFCFGNCGDKVKNCDACSMLPYWRSHTPVNGVWCISLRKPKIMPVIQLRACKFWAYECLCFKRSVKSNPFINKAICKSIYYIILFIFVCVCVFFQCLCEYQETICRSVYPFTTGVVRIKLKLKAVSKHLPAESFPWLGRYLPLNVLIADYWKLIVKLGPLINGTTTWEQEGKCYTCAFFALAILDTEQWDETKEEQEMNIESDSDLHPQKFQRKSFPCCCCWQSTQNRGFS